jgi:hypothetical protein
MQDAAAKIEMHDWWCAENISPFCDKYDDMTKSVFESVSKGNVPPAPSKKLQMKYLPYNYYLHDIGNMHVAFCKVEEHAGREVCTKWLESEMKTRYDTDQDSVAMHALFCDKNADTQLCKIWKENQVYMQKAIDRGALPDSRQESSSMGGPPDLRHVETMFKEWCAIGDHRKRQLCMEHGHHTFENTVVRAAEVYDKMHQSWCEDHEDSICRLYEFVRPARQDAIKHGHHPPPAPLKDADGSVDYKARDIMRERFCKLAENTQEALCTDDSSWYSYEQMAKDVREIEDMHSMWCAGDAARSTTVLCSTWADGFADRQAQLDLGFRPDVGAQDAQKKGSDDLPEISDVYDMHAEFCNEDGKHSESAICEAWGTSRLKSDVEKKRIKERMEAKNEL